MTKRPMNHPRTVGAIQSKLKGLPFSGAPSGFTAPILKPLKKMLVISPNPGDATSWYRSSGPFACFRSPDWKIEYVRRGQGIEWTEIMENDVILLQRPYDESALICAQVAVSFNRAVWVDFDDDLFSVPQYNKAFHVYQSQTQETIKRIISLASVVTVTTEALAQKLRALVPNKDVVVVPNAWNDSVHQWEKKPFKPHKRIFWRGGDSHSGDLNQHAAAIREIQATFPDYEWWFVGDTIFFNFLIDSLIPQDKLIKVTAMPLVKYYNFLKKFEASIGIVPLQDNIFNRSKSNIAWQEYTMAGLATVAPNWEEWHQGPCAYYDENTPGMSFVDAFKNAVENAEKLYNESWEKIPRLSQVNKLRFEIMNGLV